MKFKLSRIIFLFVFFIATNAHANQIDRLLAKTSIALGNEYVKIAAEYNKNITKYLEQYPDLYSENPIGIDSDVIEDYRNNISKFEEYKELAINEYKLVLCSEEADCPDGNKPLVLDVNSGYLRREAFNRASLVGNNQVGKDTISRYASIYASNSNFSDHILTTLKGMVDQQEKLDEKARNLKQRYNEVISAYVDEEKNEIVGVDLALLREQNYLLSNQDQVISYKSCVERETITDNHEKSEFESASAQYDILIKNLDSHFEKVFDTSYTNPGSGDVFTVEANLGWQNSGLLLDADADVLIQSWGRWNVKGAASQYKKGDIYTPPASPVTTLGFFKKIGKVVKSVVGPVMSIARGVLTKIGILPEKQLEEHLDNVGLSGLSRITQANLRSDASGYSFSFSDSSGKSEGSSTSAGLNLKWFSMSQSGSTGSSVGKSNGGTYEFMLKTTAVSSEPVGAMIGSFCNNDPSSDSSCEKFLIGKENIIRVPTDIGSKKLWLRANDNENYSSNSGSVQVRAKKHTKFSTYWKQYLNWFDEGCAEDKSTCGLNAILENIASISNPYQLARSSFTRKFPEFPQEVRSLILEEINYLIQLKVIVKELQSKEVSRELNFVKIAACKDQLKNSQERVANTYDMIALYNKIEQTNKIKQLLLEKSREFYQQELVGINRVREQNLKRVERYFSMAVNSYNYLYQQEFELLKDPSEYREGEYYKFQLGIMEDSILEITAQNDLLNPNRGFVVYQLPQEDLKVLQNKDFRNRKIQFRLNMNEFMCRGFNLNDQTRVMVEKVGVLLDLDPKREHLFFANSHLRNTKMSLVHGSENRFYDFSGNEVEYWMPSQKRKINAFSTRVLVDHDSDYLSLRESRYFERKSFRKTSFSTTWRMDMLDPQVNMYEESDTSFTDPILKGVKFVLWYNSTDLQTEDPINRCLLPAWNVSSNLVTSPSVQSEISFSYDTEDEDFNQAQRFMIYRSLDPNYGYKRVGHVNTSDVSSCSTSGTNFNCTYVDTEFENTSGETYYYKVRTAYKNENDSTYKLGLFSKTTSVTLP